MRPVRLLPVGMLPLVVGSLLLSLGAVGCGARTSVDDTGGGGEAGTTTTTTTGTTCACASDADCPAGTVCSACECLSECAAPGGCPQPLGCCSGACTDFSSDPSNCGGCEQVCDLPHATAACVDFGCVVASCDAGFADCDGSHSNGCETPAAACVCSAGEVAGCYGGPAGTEGVGVCKGGVAQCVGGAGWGPCEGEVVPSAEACDGLDGDCDGHGDDWDPDGDGWSACDGDCCETALCSPTPELVNPGAMEHPANFVDDDCNPGTGDDEPYPTCSEIALQTPTSSLELLKAMDLCVFTVESPASPKDATWGVISAALTLADGSSAPSDVQVGVLSGYGQVTSPQYGETMAAMSTGTARDEGDPGFVHPQNGYAIGQIGNFVAGTLAAIPADFLAPSAGQVPSGCFPCEGSCAAAFDSVGLKVRIRTPTNADALEFHASFFSAEYPESVCSEFDDFFVALLDSQHPDTPADKNVARAPGGELLSVNTAPFSVCVQPQCSMGAEELVGTGMGGWDGTLVDGGGTSWVLAGAPIVPGETIELRFAVWDATDGNVDSLVLLDRFRFRVIGEGAPPSP